ncbi:hypothetical protein EDD36DRAFT_469065 [Exophiala viscosa]|uniref:Uncharacterized protein n=1 Tax=Exophiala viscosa TaxID=2486360 RepID=A0AAN6DNS3_9EURO|nr:hypothetical protein EDD36DRAFT_469065 [Exophiala viscosa]
MASASDTTREGEQPIRDIPGEAEHVEDVGNRGGIPQIESPPESEPSSSDTILDIWPDSSSEVDPAIIRRVRQLVDQIGIGEELLRQIFLRARTSTLPLNARVRHRKSTETLYVTGRGICSWSKDDDNYSQSNLKISDIQLTTECFNLYLLWLYTYDYPLLSRWRDQLWPDDLEGALEVLILAAHVKSRKQHDHDLLRKSQQTVEEILPTKVMILTDDELSPYHKEARASIERFLEILFEQQSKVEYFNTLRTQFMTDIFFNSSVLLPKHKWLNKWIGRSPAFKAEFKLTRKKLLEEQQIHRRAQPMDEDVEQKDERCEAFEDTLPATQAIQPLHPSLLAPQLGLLPPQLSLVPPQPKGRPAEPDLLHPQWQPRPLSPSPQMDLPQLRRQPALRERNKVTVKEERVSYTDELETDELATDGLETDPLVDFPLTSGETEDDPVATLGNTVWREYVRRCNDPATVPETVNDAKDTDFNVRESVRSAKDTGMEEDIVWRPNDPTYVHKTTSYAEEAPPHDESTSGDALTDEELARKLQEEWAKEDAERADSDAGESTRRAKEIDPEMELWWFLLRDTGLDDP